MTKHIFTTLLILLAHLLAPIPASAVDILDITTPDPLTEQWRWTTFDNENGLKGKIHDIFEDKDGRIWFATSTGAQCYDGYSLVTYTKEEGLVDDWVYSISQDQQGAMWFGTRYGISKYDGTRWLSYGGWTGLSKGHVRVLYHDRNGDLWAAITVRGDSLGTQSGISRFDGQSWSQVEVPDGAPRPIVTTIKETSDGSVWFGTRGITSEILRLHGGRWYRYGADDRRGFYGNIFESRDGSIWVAHWPNGISRFHGNKWRSYSSKDGLPENYAIASFWESQDGVLHAAGLGIHRFDGTRWSSYPDEKTVPPRSELLIAKPTSDGALWAFVWRTRPKAYRFDRNSTRWTIYSGFPESLGSGTARETLMSIDNELWLPSKGGLVRGTGGLWKQYNRADGLIDSPTTVIKGKDGTVWAAGQHDTSSAVSKFDGTNWQRIEDEGLIGANIFTGFVSRNGDLWFGSKGGSTRDPFRAGSGLMRYDGTSWKTYTTEDGLIRNVIYGIDQTSDGRMWIGTLGGLSIFDRKHWESYKPVGDGSLNRQKIRTLAVTSQDAVWIGQASQDGGAARYNGKSWTWFTEKDGLPLDVWDLHERRNGEIWAAHTTTFSRYDGHRWHNFDPASETGIEIGWTSSRSIAEISDDAIWFRAGDRGETLLRFEPERPAPETFIEPAEDRVSASGNIVLRWSGRHLWDHTHPDNILYQWRMDEGDWTSPSNLGTFTFTSLADGEHAFEVRAFDRDGNSDQSPAVHTFIVDPPLWKNPLVLGLAFVLLSFAGLQTSRVIRRDRVLKLANEELITKTQDLEGANTALSAANHELFQVNSELQRDRAVERIRGQVQSMQKASDFEAVLSSLSEDITTVGLQFETCSIDVLDDPGEELTMPYLEAHGLQYRTYKLDPDGVVTQETYHLAAPFPDMMRAPIERFVAGQVWQGRDVDLGAMIEIPIAHYGRLRMTARGRETFAEEDIEALQEFAGAIALGYARYLDFHLLELQNQQIQEQTERKSRFLASMSHELRTPMNAIIGFTKMVMRRSGDVLPERQKDNLSKVTQSADHLLSLINDILDLSKIEAGRMEVTPEPYNVKDLVASCCATVSPMIKSGVQLTQEVAEDINEANTDHARLRQILINLLSNATKFTDAGSISLSVKKNSEALVFSVTDTGIGIPPHALDTIFEEFRQVDSAKQQQKGTGLGLSITKGWTELLGGTITVESEVNKGSTFTATIPIIYQGE